MNRLFRQSAFLGRRAVRALTLVAEFGLAHGFSQTAGMLAGFIYVRYMSVEQYALYALCLTTLGLISVASDFGLNGSLNYFWRISIQGGSPFGPKLTAVRRLRSVLVAGALGVGGFVLFTSLGSRNTPLPTSVFCFALLAITAILTAQIGIELQTMRLEGRQRMSYLCESAGAGARFVGALSMIATGIGTAWYGLAGGMVGAILTTAAIDRVRSTMSCESHAVSSSDWRDIRGYILPLVPSVAVFTVQEPLVYWFAATHTGSTAVAQVFALSRIGAIWATIGMFTYVVLLPRLSRIAEDGRFMRLTALSFVAMALLAGSGLLAASLAPGLLLLLIGSNYENLQAELMITMAMSSCSILTSFLVLTARVQGWVKFDPILAIWQLGAIISLCAMCDFESTRSVLQLNLAIAVSSLLCASFVFACGAMRPQLVAVRPL